MLFEKHVRRLCGILERLSNMIDGPMCITLGPSFLILGTICFYDVIAPGLSYPIISIPMCLLITLNLYMHYYYAVTISPGFLGDPPRDSMNSFLWARKPNLDKGEKTTIREASQSEKGVKIAPASMEQCQKCEKLRPERSHHCHRCNKCVLKYDHHCPVRVNQCVGLHNERHFVLMMVYMMIASITLLTTGFWHFIHAYIHSSLGITFRKWDANISETWFVRAYISVGIMCCAIACMLGSTLLGIAAGETSGESQLNEGFRQRAKEHDMEFINAYNCGKWKNLLFFFNIQEGGYSLITLVLPLRINPYTDGLSWAKKDGFEEYPSFRKAKPRTTMMMKMYKLFSFF